MRQIFVCSPYSGDEEGNTARALAYCAGVTELGMRPRAPHVYYTRWLNDSNPVEREIGIRMAMADLAECDELWAFGEPSPGMRAEMISAINQGIKVRLMPADWKPDDLSWKDHGADPLGALIAYMRRGRGLAPDDLAARTGVTLRLVEAWEAGRVRPTCTQGIALLEGLLAEPAQACAFWSLVGLPVAPEPECPF